MRNSNLSEFHKKEKLLKSNGWKRRTGGNYVYGRDSKCVLSRVEIEETPLSVLETLYCIKVNNRR